MKETQATTVVQVGDLRDFFTLSKYAKSLNVMKPAVEVVEGTKWAFEMWDGVKDAVPQAKCYQIMGNHDERAAKLMMGRCPELEPLLDIERFFTFPGVTTIHDAKEELFIGDWAVMHGYKSNGAHARHNQCNTLIGHLHTGRCEWFANRRGPYCELNAGFGGDVRSPVFSYRNQKKIHGWTLGLAVIDDCGPRFEPFTGRP